MQCSYLLKRSGISFKRIRLYRCISRCLLCCLFLFSLAANYLTVTAEEIQEGNTYYNMNQLRTSGTLTLIGSSTGYGVVQDYSGSHMLFFPLEAESALVWDTYITSVSQNQINGFVDNLKSFYIDQGGYIYISQTVYSSGTISNTREGYGIYRYAADEVDTNLLYRPQRQNQVLNYFIAGAVVLIISTVIKRIRE